MRTRGPKIPTEAAVITQVEAVADAITAQVNGLMNARSTVELGYELVGDLWRLLDSVAPIRARCVRARRELAEKEGPACVGPPVTGNLVTAEAHVKVKASALRKMADPEEESNA